MSRKTAISSMFVIVAMLLSGFSAYLSQNHVLLVACGVVLLCSAGLVLAWVIQRNRGTPQPERPSDSA
ncbi:hypothetical protein [Nocardiopsis sp. MG754419]|uniref:hypothetical protein n=1 Tax=Nocardiopsis sp. MG754419 TaxID=2259865 RepID=UPI001BA87EB3|nr:hypothetical protein [Nocardiopsis sp. MG754419]MBR8742812.1 hypothetical protein [Nocardiopsis sp. MG754419]